MRYNRIMDKENYYQKRNINNLKKIEYLKDELPPFIGEYFIGIENQTSTLTRLNYAYDLRIFFHYIVHYCIKNKTVRDLTYADLERITSTDIEKFLSYLTYYDFNGTTESCNERAKARKLSTIRAMFKYFFAKEKISVNNASKVATPKLHEKEIIRLETNEIASLLNCVDSGEGMTPQQQAFHSLTKERDAAILTLFLGTGIRISELVGLNEDDINFKNNSFKIIRKGGNEAVLYFSDEVAQALNNYIQKKNQLREKNISFTKDPALFLSLKQKRISIRAVENLVKKYSQLVVPLKKISPHKLRSTYGTQLYRKTQDIYVVADVLGHKDVNTTKKHYAAISEDIRKNVADVIQLRDDNYER